MLASVTNQITGLSNAVYGFLGVGREENLRSRIKRLARLVCNRTKEPSWEIPREKREELTRVRKLLSYHPYDPEVNPQGTIPGNTDWVNCDRVYSRWARRLTGKIYSEEILIESIPMMRSTAAEIIKNEICKHINDYNIEIDDGYDNLLDVDPKVKQEPLRKYCRITGTALMSLDLGAGFGPGFLVNMDLVPNLILQAIYNYSYDPQLQERSYREIQRLASNPTVLNEEVLGVVLEALRLDPPAANPRRGGEEIGVHEYGWDKDVVGPNPEEVNTQRYKKEHLRSLSRLPASPFGGGPNICPGTRIIKFVPVQFLVELLSHYRIEPPIDDEKKFSLHYYRFIPRHPIL